MNFQKMRDYAPALLRYGLSLLFLWFGLNQLFDPGSWLAWLPGWVLALPIQPTVFLYVNGFFEVSLGVLLALGLFTRFSALLLSLHLFGIAFNLGYNDIAVRDFCLALSTLAVFFHGADRWCYERKFRKSWWGHTSLARLLFLYEED